MRGSPQSPRSPANPWGLQDTSATGRDPKGGRSGRFMPAQPPLMGVRTAARGGVREAPRCTPSFPPGPSTHLSPAPRHRDNDSRGKPINQNPSRGSWGPPAATCHWIRALVAPRPPSLPANHLRLTGRPCALSRLFQSHPLKVWPRPGHTLRSPRETDTRHTNPGNDAERGERPYLNLKALPHSGGGVACSQALPHTLDWTSMAGDRHRDGSWPPMWQAQATWTGP